MNIATVYDNFFTTEELEKVKSCIDFPARIGENNILEDIGVLPKRQLLHSLALDYDSSVTEPCLAHSIVMEAYDEKTKDFAYWEPHHDGKESKVITLLFIDLEKDKWVGGELDVYSSLDVFDYPHNKQRIEPVAGRVVVFESSNVHCIRPYFGSTPRLTISIGWS